MDHFPLRGCYTVFSEFLLGTNFIERGLAYAYAFTRVCNVSTFENFLNLAIFAKRPVNCDEREIDIDWQLEVFVANVDLHHFDAQRPQRFRHAPARRERNLSLRSWSSHQHSDFLW